MITTQIIEKFWGVQPGLLKGRERWWILADGSKTSLNYARKSFAIKESEKFIRFVWPKVKEIKFSFIRQDRNNNGEVI